MISLDQVLILEEKVENAVSKIEQLNAENAALRRKCAELTNALSAKTEQFSNFQSDQGKIEEGILKALERLNAVENAVHSAAQLAEKVPVASPTSTIQKTAASAQPAQTKPQTVVQTQPIQQTGQTEQKPVVKPVTQESFDTALPVNSGTEQKTNQENTQEQQTIQPAFDIF